MITEIEIQNFKPFKNLSISTTSLNVLAGMNGMGKSSLVQMLLLLRQSIGTIGTGRIQLNGDLVNIGKGSDVLYQYSNQKYLKFLIKNEEGYERTWTFDYSPERDFLLSKNLNDLDDLNKFSVFGDNFQYLHAERIGPQESYKTSSYNVVQKRQIGIHGEHTVHFLHVYGNEKINPDLKSHDKSRTNLLIHQTEAWMSEISPETKLNTTQVPNTDLILMDIQFGTNKDYTNRFRMTNVGFGISYVLPVVVALLTATPGKLIIIENPEAHLHPRGQAEMGKLIALAAQSGAQIFIETHSDHIINGIRLAVKKQFLDNKKVTLFYFERVNEIDEQYSKVSPIKIDQKGELSDYPKNFMDEWNNQLFQLLRP